MLLCACSGQMNPYPFASSYQRQIPVCMSAACAVKAAASSSARVHSRPAAVPVDMLRAAGAVAAGLYSDRCQHSAIYSCLQLRSEKTVCGGRTVQVVKGDSMQQEWLQQGGISNSQCSAHAVHVQCCTLCVLPALRCATVRTVACVAVHAALVCDGVRLQWGGGPVQHGSGDLGLTSRASKLLARNKCTFRSCRHSLIS